MSELEIIIGIFVAIVVAAMLYFSIAVIKKERGELAEKTTTRKVESREKKPKVSVKKETIALTEVKGIGSKLSEKLRNAGIKDAKELAASNPKKIAEALGVSEERASRFIENARSLLQVEHDPDAVRADIERLEKEIKLLEDIIQKHKEQIKTLQGYLDEQK